MIKGELFSKELSNHINDGQPDNMTERRNLCLFPTLNCFCPHSWIHWTF